MTYDRTKDAPFPNAAQTGWSFISPCCTAGATEFLVDGTYWLAGSVAGHGWSSPWRGRIADINDDGTIAAPDGTERKIRWRPEREPDSATATVMTVAPNRKTQVTLAFGGYIEPGK